MKFSQAKALLNGSRFGAAGLRALADVFVNIGPAFNDAGSVLLRNQTETGVAELDHGDAVFFTQAVLHVIGDRVGHEERPGNFQQSRPLDGLHEAPEVTVAFAEIAEPAPAWPRFELHRHGRAVQRFAIGAKLID